MKATQTVLSLLLVCAWTGSGWAQRTESRSEESKQKSSSESGTKADAADVQRWIRALGDPNYQVRKDAETHLQQIGKQAQKALAEAAEADKDAEVQWRARRLMQQIEGAGRDERAERPRQDRTLRRLQPRLQRDQDDQPRVFSVPRNGNNLDQMFDQVFEQLERDFQIDVPRRSFFNDQFFQDLRDQMQQLRQPFGLDGQSQSMQMQMGPDGVRVEIRSKDKDGKEQTQVYEADDMESLRAQHPEVFERTGPLPGMQFGLPKIFPRVQPRVQVVPPPAGRVPILEDTSDRLGVTVREEISEDLRDFLGLEPGIGLMVEEVLPDALGNRLHLQRGDVVLTVAGKTVGTPEDVRAALQSVKADAEVKVVVNRRGSELELKAKKSVPQSGRLLQPRKEGQKSETKSESSEGTEEKSTGEKGRLRIR